MLEGALECTLSPKLDPATLHNVDAQRVMWPIEIAHTSQDQGEGVGPNLNATQSTLVSPPRCTGNTGIEHESGMVVQAAACFQPMVREKPTRLDSL